MSIIEKIKIPQDGVSDESVLITDVFFKTNDFIKHNDVILEYETSKATFEISAETKGYIKILCEVNDTIVINKVVAEIHDNKIDINKVNENKGKLDSRIKQVLSKKAKKLIDSNNLDISSLNNLKIITENNILELLSKDKNYEPNSINDENNIESFQNIKGNKKIGKDLMLYSVNNIPQSYVEKIFKIDNIDNKIKLYTKSSGKMVTLLSVFIYSIAQTLKKHEIFNSFRDGNRINMYRDINIGVVINHDNKISVPVIKKADSFNALDIVKTLFGFRKNLMIKKSKPNDFSDGTFTISAMDHTNITRFIPIIHPKQAAVFALPKIIENYDINNEGKIVMSKFINIGLSFDHSFLDASIASEFLDSLESELNKIII